MAQFVANRCHTPDRVAGTVGAAGKGRGGAIYDANRHHIDGLGSDTFSGKFRHHER
jgi:hypothetical protein